MSETTAVVMGKEGNESAQGAAQVTTKVEASVDTKRIEELLEKINKSNKKQVGWARTAALFMILLFLVIGGALFIMVPQIMSTLNSINAAVAQANDILVQANDILAQGNDLLTQAEGTLVEINTMSSSITTTSDQVNQVLSENSEALASSIAQIEAIDFEGLNSAISDIEITIEPLAKIMSRFGSKK